MKIADWIGEATAYDKKETLEEKKSRSWLKVSVLLQTAAAVCCFSAFPMMMYWLA